MRDADRERHHWHGVAAQEYHQKYHKLKSDLRNLVDLWEGAKPEEKEDPVAKAVSIGIYNTRLHCASMVKELLDGGE